MEDYLRSVTTKDFATKPKALPTGQPNSSKEKLKLKLMNGGDIRLMNVKVMCARVECANRRRSGGGFLPDAARRWLLARCCAAVASCPMRHGGGFLPDAARWWLLARCCAAVASLSFVVECIAQGKRGLEDVNV